MNLRECPKFNSCSAPVCPLANINVTHLAGEPVCFYSREYVKNGGRGLLFRYIPREMVNLIADSLPEIKSRHADIKRRLDRASKSGSKLETFKNSRGQAA